MIWAAEVFKYFIDSVHSTASLDTVAGKFAEQEVSIRRGFEVRFPLAV